MSKKIVDLTVTEVPAAQTESESPRAPKKGAMPGDASHYKGKKSGQTLKCADCGGARKRGTQLCPACIGSYKAEDEATRNKRMRQ